MTMRAATRVRLRRQRGWRMPANTVKVDRSTRWGNPFVVGRHGDREACVRLYHRLLAGELCHGMDNLDAQRRTLIQVRGHLHELTGRNLACWCPLDAPCHADVLLALANDAAYCDKE
ncbi:DUF4326 domain-containing protein [Arhodomonas sp. AD133]|uniref:DUF4326 domain-containing protein n=1 Tax=Arhodomonas sp. AD133 TaxID=3415009 RepID=UPI003EBFC6CD